MEFTKQAVGIHRHSMCRSLRLRVESSGVAISANRWRRALRVSHSQRSDLQRRLLVSSVRGRWQWDRRRLSSRFGWERPASGGLAGQRKPDFAVVWLVVCKAHKDAGAERASATADAN